MAEFKGIFLLSLAAPWCIAFQTRDESFSTLQITPGHFRLRMPNDLSVGLFPHTRSVGVFCLDLRGGQGEKKQRSEDKAKNAIQTSSSDKANTKKPQIKNREEVLHSKKSKPEDDPISESQSSELDFSKLTLKV